MGRRAWLVFLVLNSLGCITATYGSVESKSAFVRWSWLVSLVSLLPGNLVAMGIIQASWKWTIHIRTIYLFVPLALISNAFLWLACAFGIRRVVLKLK